MTFNGKMIQLLTELLAQLRAQAREDDEPRAPRAPEPEERRLRQSERPGVDMNDLRRAADRERSQRRLPRSPEECRRLRYWE